MLNRIPSAKASNKHILLHALGSVLLGFQSSLQQCIVALHTAVLDAAQRAQRRAELEQDLELRCDVCNIESLRETKGSQVRSAGALRDKAAGVGWERRSRRLGQSAQTMDVCPECARDERMNPPQRVGDA